MQLNRALAKCKGALAKLFEERRTAILKTNPQVRFQV
jgi:hypothetical protein